MTKKEETQEKPNNELFSNLTGMGHKTVSPTDLHLDTKGHDNDRFDFRWDDYSGQTIAFAMSTFECGNCGERFAAHPIDELNLSFMAADVEPCPTINPITEVVLNVPSGKMIITDNLIRQFKLPEKTDTYPYSSVNNKLGRINKTKEYEKLGVLFVSTTSMVSFYSMDDGSMAFAKLSEDDEYNEVNEIGVKKELAYVCTDLWAYCAVDYDHFINSGFTLEELQEHSHATVVDVIPGKYVITNYVEVEGFEPHSGDSEILSTVKLVID